MAKNTLQGSGWGEAPQIGLGSPIRCKASGHSSAARQQQTGLCICAHPMPQGPDHRLAAAAPPHPLLTTATLASSTMGSLRPLPRA